MTDLTQRWVLLDGSRNCRDLGGITLANGRTRRGVVYRADALHKLSDRDQTTLEELNLASIIDLRAKFEIKRAPNRLSPVLASRVEELSFISKRTHHMFERIVNDELTAEDVHRCMLEQYRALALEHCKDYRRVIDRLMVAARTGSVLFHCTSGKDRTGMVSAILLAALGAEEDDIVADYMLTNKRIEPVSFLDNVRDPAIVRHIMAAAPEYITTALEVMKKNYGSIDNYLVTEIGIDNAKRDTLGDLMID